MKRRSILTGAAALGAAALSSYAQLESENLRQGIRVAAGEDRFGKHSPLGNSRVVDVKVSGKDTNGTWCSIDAAWQGTGGPPLHVHHYP